MGAEEVNRGHPPDWHSLPPIVPPRIFFQNFFLPLLFPMLKVVIYRLFSGFEGVFSVFVVG